MRSSLPCINISVRIELTKFYPLKDFFVNFDETFSLTLLLIGLNLF